MEKTRLYWAFADFGDCDILFLRANSRGKAKAFVSAETDVPFVEIKISLVKPNDAIFLDDEQTRYRFKKDFEKDIPQQDGEDWDTANFDNLVELDDEYNKHLRKGENKMKEKEALEKLNHTICLNANTGGIKWGVDTDEHIDCVSVDEFCDCYDVLDKVVAKAEPMKVNNYYNGFAKCKCKTLVNELFDNFCPHCGQALDWSDEK
jgi:hypothetical protein